MSQNLVFKHLRERLSLTQSEFANKIGVSQGTVGDIERGRIGVSKNVKAKIFDKIGVESGFFDNKNVLKIAKESQGGKSGLKQGKISLKKQILSLTSERKLDLLIPYLSLNDADIDYEIAFEIDNFKDAYEDYQKLLKAIYTLNPPDFFRKKFPLGSSFSEYLKRTETAYSEDLDQDNKMNSFTKIDKIFNLYKSNQDHCRYQLSLLIEYFNRYADFFLDSNDRKREL